MTLSCWPFYFIDEIKEMVKHARHNIDKRLFNVVLLIFIFIDWHLYFALSTVSNTPTYCNVTNNFVFGGIDEVKGISCDCRHQKMLLYTHLIRIWTNNNHLKIFSWLKYKSFHVYGTLKIFHLFSRKKDEYAWTLTTDWINIVSPSPSSSLLLSVSPSFIIVHSWTNHVRCIH